MSKVKRIAPDPTTKLHLAATSGGYCQNPDCLFPLFIGLDHKNFYIYEMAHISSASDTGPRANIELSTSQRGEFSNLIVLCPNCHTMIDKSEDDFPETLLRKWKLDHKSKIDDLFQITEHEERFLAYRDVHKYFSQNRAIFNTYGPHLEEHLNPESDFPKIWLKKIYTQIIPNNRRLLATFDRNHSLLLKDEFEHIENFRNHVNDFEAKHIGGCDFSGMLFPNKILDVFK